MIIFRLIAICLIVFSQDATASIDIEIKDWFSDGEARSQKLDFQCETIWDSRIYSTAAYSGLWVIAYPITDGKKKLVLENTQVLFDEQTERKPIVYDKDSFSIEKSMNSQFAIPLEIEDLQRFNKIKISFKVTDDKGGSPCAVTIQKQRTPRPGAPSVIYKRLPQLVTHFGLGAAILRDPNISQVSTSGPMASFGLLGFLDDHNGLAINMALAGYTNATPLVRYGFTAGYAYRHFFHQNLGLTYSLGAGVSLANREGSSTTASFAALQELYLDYHFYHSTHIWGVGIGINHSYSPGLVYGSSSLSGSEVGALIRIVYGWTPTRW